MARKGVYDTNYHPHILRILRVKKMKDPEIYAEMGISHQTYYRWLEKYPEMREAYKFGVETLVSRAIEATTKIAFGYEENERSVSVQTDCEGNKTSTVKNTNKHFQPNQRALEFLLTNLAPEMFKNIQNVNHSGEVKTGIDIEKLTEDQLLLLSKLPMTSKE